MDPHPRYQILEKIASGSFATVYRGRDLELGRDVAIKQIHEHFLENPQQLDRYWQEAQLLASFQHPNIVTIYDLVRERGWLILELMQGNLAKTAGKKAMDLNALRTTLAHCLRALKFLHAHGIVHGDIKPSNMMIDRRRRVKIGDFGLARRVSDDDGSLLKGTTKYMAPEVVSDEFGVVGPPSDLYSLGFAAFELMCGENFESLFPGLSAFGRDKQIAWMMWHAARDRRLPDIKKVLEGVPEDLARTVQKLTAKPLEERYKTADEALSDLNIDIKLIKTGEDGATDDVAGRDGGAAKKKRMIAIGAFAASAVLSLVVAFLPTGGKSQPDLAANSQVTMGVLREISIDPKLPLDQQKIVLEDESGVPQEVVIGKPVVRLNAYNPQSRAVEDKWVLPQVLEVGDWVEVKPNPNAGSSSKAPPLMIEARRPVKNVGQVKQIDVPDRRFDLGIDDGASREDVPLRVPEAAKISINGKTAAFSDLQVDDRVEVLHLKDVSRQGAGRVVVQLTIQRTVKMTGFLGAVDQAKRTLTVEQRGGRAVQKVVLPVAETCRIVVNGEDSQTGRAFTLADLKVGDRVEVQHDSHITEVDATRRAHVSGVVMSVSEETQQVVVQTKDRRQLTFSISPNCAIVLMREPAHFDELRKFDEVDVTYDEQAGVDGDARTLDASRPTKGDRLAILIGGSNFTDKNVSRLEHGGPDVQLLHDILLKRYAFSTERLVLLKDQDKSAIQQAVTDELKRSTNLTQVLVYFVGHGYLDAEGVACLAPHDLNWSDLPKSSLRLDWLVEQLEKCVAREKILLLDTSHAGSGADLANEPASADLFESLRMQKTPINIKSTSVIASCAKGEIGRDWPEKGHGVFAYVLAEAYSGKADKNRDLIIDARELYDFLKPALTQPASSEQPTQAPVLFQP